MKKLYYLQMAFVAIFMLFNTATLAQGGHHHGGNFDPDSLTLVTVSGTAIVDSSLMAHPMYYLDEDGNGQADYHLNFGPWWYQPDSSNAVRPQNGDAITIAGGLNEIHVGGIETIVVYEINGEFWRDPFNAHWNTLGHHSHQGGHHQGGCHGNTFGWMHDSLQTVSVNGVALVDTTFVMEHFYLDTDSDSVPDYRLNFGPPWYEPTTGATRPSHGNQIDILGGMIANFSPPTVIVYEINGLFWRDSTAIGHHFGGSWIHRNMGQPQTVHTPFDPEDWMQMTPGWHHGGGGHHGGMPDSLFCQIMEVYPQNIPGTGNQTVLSGYEIGIFSPDGSNNMWGNGGCGGHMAFNSSSHFQLHYNDVQLQGHNINEHTIRAKVWDGHSNSWSEPAGQVLDMVNNTVSFTSTQVSNYIVLTGTENPLSINHPNEYVSKDFTLRQNYPNPFNPGTIIEFTLNKNAHVVLTIYNALGQALFTLLEEPLNTGVHKVAFDGKTLPSGIYFYQLKVNGQSRVMRMNLTK